jgi:acyl phosphate:glycerol-3-phosphate acyltransferase
VNILLLVAAYLIGGIPFGYVLVKMTTGEDVRAKGSGNIGATNVMRIMGRGLGLATLFLDIFKGWAAVWLMARFGSAEPFWIAGAGLAVIAGHAFPVFLQFQGGKAVASFVGAFLYLAPGPLAAITIIFMAVVALTRFISLGAIIGAGLLPLAVWMIDHPGPELVWASAIGGVFIIWRHKANLQRLRAGTENVFTFGKQKQAAG